MAKLKCLDQKGKYSLFCLNDNDEWQQLENKYASKTTDKIVFSNVLQYVNKKLKCKTLLIEEDYICSDYRDEYAILYSKTFKAHKSSCIRLHFFKNELSSISEINTIDNVDYVGFSVIRPIGIQNIGKTVIAPWTDKEIVDSFYPLCVTDYTAHILGREFIFQGAPFIQQDSMVMVCAHSAIWMSSRYMSKITKTSESLPSQISLYASQVASRSSRHLPSETLSDTQMIRAFQKMGFSPYYEYMKNNDSYKLFSTCYPYLESKMSVILGTPGHVVTIVGHTFESEPEKVEQKVDYLEANNRSGYLLSDLWVNGLIIHDDSQGPYKLMPIDDQAKADFLKSDNFKDLLHSEYTFDYVHSILVPLPTSVYILGEHVKFTTVELLNSLIGSYLSKFPTSELRECFDPKKRNPAVLRFYLTSSNSYKKTLHQQMASDSNMSKILIENYKHLNMPQYIWVCEITTKEYLSHEKECDRRILGEVLVDAKAHKSDPESFLAIHLPGQLLTKDDQGDHQEIVLNDDLPYCHPSRQQLTKVLPKIVKTAIAPAKTK